MFTDVFKKGAELAAEDKLTFPPLKGVKEAMEPTRSTKSTNAHISEDVEFKGTLCFSSSMEINGRFEGEIIADGPLIIGESAVVKADIQAQSTVVIRGKMQGNIDAKDKVEVAAKAQLYGDVVSPRFSLSDGATFVGNSRTTEKTAPPADFGNLFNRLEKPARNTPSPIV
ncbi:MAG: polymer-forming cytoskeletal protein [Candidatus Methylacidiphilales bacterium]|nr:polymer-forming cytoskeletal protein [Candidatus Methylacidiphilales bacterium]